MKEVILKSLTLEGYINIKNNIADDSKETLINKIMFNKLKFKRIILEGEKEIKITFIIGNPYFQKLLTKESFCGMIQEKLKNTVYKIDYDIEVKE